VNNPEEWVCILRRNASPQSGFGGLRAEYSGVESARPIFLIFHKLLIFKNINSNFLFFLKKVEQPPNGCHICQDGVVVKCIQLSDGVYKR
jgi:hypothetical protein